MKKFYTIIVAMAFAKAAVAADPTMTPAEGYPDFAMGGDLSWTTRIQDASTPTYYLGNVIASDQVTTIPDMVLDHGFDAVRLRVWVDPTVPIVSGNDWYVKIDGYTYKCVSTHGYCGTSDLVSLATTFAMGGARVMVAFHLSDTFADPARQFIPKAWEDCTTADELAERAAQYVEGVLTQLYEANVNVQWVQIGNETSTGMLKYKLPENSYDTVSLNSLNCEISNTNTAGTQNFVKVYSACAEAAKKVYPQAKRLIHLASGEKWSDINWMLSTVQAQGFNNEMCDLIGLSLYPCPDQDTANWKTPTAKCLATIDNIYATYGLRSIICEIGMNNEWSESSSDTSQEGNIEQCNADVRAFTQYLIDNLSNKESYCDGFFYWEPEVDYLDDYKMGACVQVDPGNWDRKHVTANDYWITVKDNSEFPAGGLVSYENLGIASVEADSDAEVRYYTLQGIEVANPSTGLYIKRQGSKSEKIFIQSR